MTLLIRFFCVSLFLSIQLIANPFIDLQFLPNEVVEITSSTRLVKESKIQDFVDRFEGIQEVNMDFSLNEENHGLDPVSKFPYHFTIVLNKIDLTCSKNDKGFDLGTIEKAEAKSLLNRPLKFVISERNGPLQFECNQNRLYGDCQIFDTHNLAGFLGEDLQDLFLLTGMPLKEGGEFRLSKKMGLIEIPVIYSVKSITTKFITVSFMGKLDRIKLNIALTDQAIIPATAKGELSGEIVLDVENNLYFTATHKAHFNYKFQLEGQESAIQFELSKIVISRPKIS